MIRKRLDRIIIALLLGGSLLVAAFLLTRQEDMLLPFSADFLCPRDAILYNFEYNSGGSTSGDLMAISNVGTGKSSLKANGTLLIQCQKEHRAIAEFISFSYQGEGLLDQEIDLKGNPFIIERNDEGTILSLNLGSKTSSLAKYIVRDILGHSSIKGNNSTKQSWETHEEDINGEYTASYEYRDKELEKMRLSYKYKSKTYLKEEDKRRVGVDKGMTILKWDKNHVLESITSNIVLVFSLKDKKIAESQSSLILKRTSDKAMFTNSLPSFDEKKSETIKLTYQEEQKRLYSILEKQALGNDNYDSIMIMMEEADDDELTPVFLKFKALLTLYPDSAKRLKDFLLATDFYNSKFHLVSGVLSHVGSVECQRALAEALTEHADTKSQMAIIGDLGITAHPTNEAENTVREHRDSTDNPDIRQTANLALGNMARSVAGEDISRYENTLKESMARLISCNSFTTCINALHVLGNIGAPETLDVAKRFLYAKDASIRVVAISSLRFVNLDAIETILLKKLIHDKDADVRKAAANEMSFRYLSKKTTETLLEQMDKESSEAVRLKILIAIANYINSKPQWVEKIKYIAVNDTSASVRDMASQITI